MMKRCLCALLLALCLTAALAEDVEHGDTVSEPVEAAVPEADFELGADVPPPEPETYIDEDAAWQGYSPDEVFVLDCPDVYDLKYLVRASDRVYPGLLVWPLKGMQPLEHVTSHVGWRNAARIHSGQGGTWPSWLHHGTDVGHVTTSQVVVAAAEGIAYAGEQNGNGLYVVIDHGNGFYTKFQHLSRFAGEMFDGCREIPVAAGDPIGYVGNSGGDYPVHFHFEIAWSPDGTGSEDIAFHEQTHNRKIYGYSFPQQKKVRMRWPDTWELCAAEKQTFAATVEELEEMENNTPEG